MNSGEYPFLQELGIEEENPGAFTGKWGGKGEVGPTMARDLYEAYAMVTEYTCRLGAVSLSAR